MTNGLIIMVIVVVAIIVCCMIARHFRAKTKILRTERRKQEAEELRKIKARLSGKKVMVVVRTSEGQLADVESYLISELISLGAHVLSVPSTLAKAIFGGERLNFEEGAKPDILITGSTNRVEYGTAISTYGYNYDGNFTFRSIDGRILDAIIRRESSEEQLARYVARNCPEVEIPAPV